MALFLLYGLSPACCQPPAIFPGGIVNAASYQAADVSSQVLLGTGTLVSIFGTNLAAETATATDTPLPTQLAGTSVSINGAAAPLLYVSPGQINLQMQRQQRQTPDSSPSRQPRARVTRTR